MSPNCIQRIQQIYFRPVFLSRYLFVARLVPDDLRRHPSHGSGEAHAGGLLAAPGPAGAKVADLNDLVAANQDAGNSGTESLAPSTFDPIYIL